MNWFYRITEAINTELKAAGFNVTTIGDYFKADIQRQNIMPYAHVVPINKAYGDEDNNTNVYSFAIIGMDIVDFNKENINDVQDTFNGTDNLIDVLNDIDNRLSKFVEQLKRGAITDEDISIDVGVTQETFLERYENTLAGWELSIDITAPNDTSIC